jgi:predicted oxidoreductase (fatty acid repression mutant protein)
VTNTTFINLLIILNFKQEHNKKYDYLKNILQTILSSTFSGSETDAKAKKIKETTTSLLFSKNMINYMCSLFL